MFIYGYNGKTYIEPILLASIDDFLLSSASIRPTAGNLFTSGEVARGMVDFQSHLFVLYLLFLLNPFSGLQHAHTLQTYHYT